MAVDNQTLGAAIVKIHEALSGVDAVQGKNCTIQSIIEVEGGNQVTFSWTADDGTVKTETMFVKNGESVDLTDYAKKEDIPKLYHRIISQGAAGYFKFKATNNPQIQQLRITATDNYGGMIDISGNVATQTQYKPFKCIRLSNGAYSSYDATSLTANKIQKLFYFDGYFYLQISSYTTVTFTGLSEAPSFVETIDSGAEEIPIKSVFDNVPIDITDEIINAYGVEIIKYPLGKWKIATTAMSRKIVDLPPDISNPTGIVTIESISDPSKTPWNGNWTYREYTFDVSLDATTYVRTLNSGDTAGVIAKDSGWIKNITESNMQAAVNTNETITKIISDLSQYVSRLSPEVVDGYYITKQGSLAALNGYAYTKPIRLDKFDELIVTAKGTSNVAIISTTDENGSSYTPVAVAPDSNVNTYNYSAKENCYISICYSKAYKNEFIKVKANKNIREYLPVLEGALRSETIQFKGLITTVEAPYDDFDTIPNNTILAFANVSNVANTPDGNIGSGTVLTIACTNTAVNTKAQIFITNKNSLWYRIKWSNAWTKWNNALRLEDVLTYLKEQIQQSSVSADFSMFERFGVIGDSYSSGEIYINGVPTDYYNLSWGQTLARMCGSKCINFSQGGLSTETWLSSDLGLKKLLEEDAQQLYILALGINDYSKRGSEYLGTISDIKDNYESNANSFYGNYGKIIAQIKEHAPNAKLIISTMANDLTTIKADYNAAIIEIGNHFGIPVIDQRTSEFFKSDLYNNGMVEGHPTATVYSGMAKTIKSLIEEQMTIQKDYFIDYVG